MLKQLQYFQSVVRLNSFSEAAEENFISQSAISQQIKALERELGFPLLERKHRALEDFSARHPDVELSVEYGNHEELYTMLRTSQVDLVLNDQRRAFSDEYVNLLLTTCSSFIEVPARSPLAQMEHITPPELKNFPCILVASPAQQEAEQEYYRTVVGFQGEFLYAENLEEARMLVIGRKGFLPVEGSGSSPLVGTSIARVPLVQNGAAILRNYCAFWKKTNTNPYVREFSDLLLSEFTA